MDTRLIPCNVPMLILDAFAQTAWGSREGADTDDAYRMVRVNQTERDMAAGIRAGELYTQ